MSQELETAHYKAVQRYRAAHPKISTLWQNGRAPVIGVIDMDTPLDRAERNVNAAMVATKELFDMLEQVPPTRRERFMRWIAQGASDWTLLLLAAAVGASLGSTITLLVAVQ